VSKTVFLLVVFVVLISIVGLVVPESSVFSFFLPSRLTSEICLLLIAALAILLSMGKSVDFYASLLGIIGTITTIGAVVGFAAPTYFGLFYDFVPQASLIAFLVLGISYSLTSLAIPHRNIFSQILDLRSIFTFSSSPEMDAELKLWVVNHAPVLLHS
jgi:hypothetical protein